MAVAVRSQTSTTYASRTNTVLTAPTGLANNDILLAWMFSAAQTTGPTPTPPTGFTQVGTSTSVTDSGGFNGKFSIFWKRAASESGSYTFTHSAASSQGVLLAISGAITSGSPIDVFSSASGSGTTSTATGVTTTVANDLLLYLSHDWEGTGTLTPPTGMTELFDNLVYGASLALGAAGATGNKVQTNGNPVPNPWAAWLVAIKPAVSGSPYTLTASVGSFSLSGQAAGLKVGRKLVSAAGSFALTGVAAGLKVGRKVTATAGGFALTGVSAGLRTDRKLPAAAGAFTLAGQSAGLKFGHRLPANAGTFTLTGISANLVYTPIPTSTYTLTAGSGSFALNGQGASLRAVRKLASSPGSFALSGQTATLRAGRKIAGGAGAFALNGVASNLRVARKLPAGAGSFSLTGKDANLVYSAGHAYRLACSPGAFALSGADVDLVYVPRLGKYNPLGRLNMYTGTLGAMSNREDWIVNISFTDEGGDAFDISAAQSIGVYVCRAGCPNDPVLTATLGEGIVLTDNFTMQWAFTENDMQRLHPSQYDVFCRIEISDITTQIMSASVAIVEGGPRQ